MGSTRESVLDSYWLVKSWTSIDGITKFWFYSLCYLYINDIILPRIIYEFSASFDEQVLGPNICLWACPTSGHIGSGLRFRTSYDLSPASTPVWLSCLYILFHTTVLLGLRREYLTVLGAHIVEIVIRDWGVGVVLFVLM